MIYIFPLKEIERFNLMIEMFKLHRYDGYIILLKITSTKKKNNCPSMK